MKNIFRFLMAVAVLFTASCAKEDISSSIGGGEVEMTFTVDLPELGTRAYGEGSQVTTLKFFVYEYENENVIGKYLPSVKIYTADNEEGTNVITSTNKHFNFSLTLIKGMKYNIVFWADKGEYSPYSPVLDANGAPTGVIKANYSDVYANDDSLDAFFGSLKNFDPAVADAQSKAGNIELKRPFAQLNAKTTDLTEIQRSGATLTKSALAVKAYTTLDLFSGNVGGLDEDNAVVFQSNLLPDDKGHISMNYLLAPSTKCTADVTLSYTFVGANVDFPATTYSYVPLQRNYRTNIIGKLLTAATDFEVTINADWEDKEKYVLTGGEITLTEDLIANNIVVKEDTVLNLNGHNVESGISYVAGLTGTDISAITIENGATLTIIGEGTIKGATYGVYAKDGNLIIKGGNYIAETSAVQVAKANVEIKGGTFKATSTDKRYVINCLDADYKNGKAVVEITGGRFEGFNPANNAAEGTNTNFVAEGYTANPDGDWYEVLRTETINITESGNYVFENLTVKTTSGPAVKIKDGINVTITLVGNVVLEGQNGSGIDATNATLTLVGGNNNKLTAKGNGDRAFGIGGSGAAVTLDGVTVDYVCGGHIQPLFINDSKYGKSEPEGGAAIGGAVVNILNSTITEADGGSKAAAIGAKFWESAVINIENSKIVEANGGNASAGIGGSRYAGEDKYNLEINIKNSNVTATGGQYGAGIGSGYDTHCNQQNYTATNSINIDATSTVKATGGMYAAGIGTGHHSAYLTGAIAAGATVTAVSGEKFYKDSYTTAQNIGYGVVDPAREFSGANTNITFTVAGEVIAHPNPEVELNGKSYRSITEAVHDAKAGDTITLVKDVTLAEALTLPAGITLNGNGKLIDGSLVAGGDVTFEGHTKVTSFSASYYNRTITIGEGACLEVTGADRVSLAYGNTFDITGNVADAKTADKATIQPSLIIPGGISITGGNDATMNITNAYVKIGSTTSKPGAANGVFTLNIENSIAEFTKEFGFYDPTGGVNPTFKLNVKNSVLTTVAKMYLTANSVVTVDNSNLNSQYFANRGVVNVTNGSVLTSATIQFGENGGNSGAITVDNSTFTITGTSTGNPYDGRGTGSITAKNDATVTVDYYKDMTITVDTTSTFTGNKVQ